MLCTENSKFISFRSTVLLREQHRIHISYINDSRNRIMKEMNRCVTKKTVNLQHIPRNGLIGCSVFQSQATSVRAHYHQKTLEFAWNDFPFIFYNFVVVNYWSFTIPKYLVVQHVNKCIKQTGNEIVHKRICSVLLPFVRATNTSRVVSFTRNRCIPPRQV